MRTDKKVVGLNIGLDKASFVRRFPKSSAETISKLAEARGVSIPTSYVYKVRSADKKAEMGVGKKPTKKSVKDMPDRMLDHAEKHTRVKTGLNVETVPPIQQRASSDPLKVSGEGLVRAFKALVIAIGTRTSRTLIEQVEDETTKMFGRPPL